MPAGDGTGPFGYGPMTGRGAGYCAGYSVPGYANRIPGRGWFGFGRGRGRGGRGFFRGSGRGWRNWFYATGMPGWSRAGYTGPGYGAYPYPADITPKEELDMLKNEADYYKNQLDDIKNRIDTLEKAQAETKK